MHDRSCSFSRHAFAADTVIARSSYGKWRGVADYAFTASHYLYPYQLTQTDPASAVAANTRIKAAGLVNFRLALSEIQLGAHAEVAQEEAVFKKVSLELLFVASAEASGEAALWVRNATDKKHVSNQIDFGPAFGNLT